MASKICYLLLLVLLANVLTIKGQVPLPQRSPAFRAATDLVQLDVSVLDRDRAPVRGLTAADFLVREGAVVQPIAAFSAVDLPDRVRSGVRWLNDVAPDVVSNRVDSGRVVILLLDDFYTPRQPDVLKLARETAYAAIDELGPRDTAAVVYMVARRNGQELTSDREKLRAAVDRFTPTGFGAPVLPSGNSAASTRAASGGGGIGVGTMRESGACMRALCMAMALRNLGDVLAGWPGARKTVLLVSPGPYFSILGVGDVPETQELRNAFGAMQRANVNVYAFDPRGLQTERPDAAWGDFKAYVESTGGRAVTDTNRPSNYVPQVFRENGSYYLLGIPADSRQDGQFHRLAVSVNRPDVEVRTRSGYYASPPERRANVAGGTGATSVDQVIASGLPGGDLPLTLTVAPFANPGATASAVLSMVAGVDFTEGGTSDELEMVATAFTEMWKTAGRVTQRVSARHSDTSIASHLDIGARLDLSPGRYQLRVAVTRPATGRIGVAHTSVTIPDFRKIPLTLSGVVFERIAQKRSDGTHPLDDVLAAAPTTTRSFHSTDAIWSRVVLYQGGNKALFRTELKVRIVDSKDQVVYERSHTLAPSDFSPSRSREERLPLPLASLSPGEHLLTFEVAAGGHSARRDVRFEVVR
jgi:VWFA-related protein